MKTSGQAIGALGDLLGTELYPVRAARRTWRFGRSPGLRRSLGFSTGLLDSATGWLTSRFHGNEVAETMADA